MSHDHFLQASQAVFENQNTDARFRKASVRREANVVTNRSQCLAAHGVRVRRIVIRELLSHSRCGESDDQGDGEEELLHRRISFVMALESKRSNRLARTSEWNMTSSSHGASHSLPSFCSTSFE